MERELILLAPKDSVLTDEEIEIEKRNMKKLFPYIESFNAFLITNEILDVVERKKNHRTSSPAESFLRREIGARAFYHLQQLKIKRERPHALFLMRMPADTLSA